MESAIKTIEQVFQSRGANQYGTEAVTQLEHGLQCAQLAEEAKAKSPLIASALLHDIGHILDPGTAGNPPSDSFDDRHEFRGDAWVKQHFGDQVADPIRLHVAAKRYLCTTDATYEQLLSPTSLKSYHDQGGPMSQEEIAGFEREPHSPEALTLRRWDDLAKDPDRKTPPLPHYLPHLSACLISR